MDFTTILWIVGALIVFQVGSSIYRKRKTKDFLVGQLDWILRLLTALYQNAKDSFEFNADLAGEPIFVSWKMEAYRIRTTVWALFSQLCLLADAIEDEKKTEIYLQRAEEMIGHLNMVFSVHKEKIGEEMKLFPARDIARRYYN